MGLLSVASNGGRDSGSSRISAARLDRNRNLINTAEDQERLAALRVGIVGLSVGHAVAHTIAMQGLCGAMRLADFDDLELTNLNRVPATVFDLGVNKAIVAARRIAEVDPYLPVDVMTGGLTPQSLDEFLDSVDVVVEECDSLRYQGPGPRGRPGTAVACADGNQRPRPGRRRALRSAAGSADLPRPAGRCRQCRSRRI